MIFATREAVIICFIPWDRLLTKTAMSSWGRGPAFVCFTTPLICMYAVPPVIFMILFFPSSLHVACTYLAYAHYNYHIRIHTHTRIHTFVRSYTHQHYTHATLTVTTAEQRCSTVDEIIKYLITTHISFCYPMLPCLHTHSTPSSHAAFRCIFPLFAASCHKCRPGVTHLSYIGLMNRLAFHMIDETRGYSGCLIPGQLSLRHPR